MIKSMIGPVTAYADAVKAGYTGTREEFASQQANFAQNAASVEASKLEIKQTVEGFSHTAETAKQDITAEGDRQLQRIEDAAPDLELDREQIASNTAAIEDVLDIAMDARTIAKGRATGYVFDTVEDMQEWLTVEENTQNLVLGDNLYIRATDVPDYWWDGVQAQKLETHKVDLSEYVKNTDYAGTNKYGIVRANNKHGNGIEIVDGDLKLYMAGVQQMNEKAPINVKRPIGAGHIDYASVQSAHQEMSNDYDPATALTPDGNVPYAYGDRQPVSYAAVKKYIDDTYNFWAEKENPDYEVTTTEEIASFLLDEINGEAFEFSEIYLSITIPIVTTESRLSFNYTGGVRGLYICNSSKNYIKNCIAHIHPLLGKMVIEKFEQNSTDSWISYNSAKSIDFKSLFNINYIFEPPIKSIGLAFEIGTIPVGTIIKIYGKPAQKGATT